MTSRRIRFALLAIILLVGSGIYGALNVDVVIMHTNDIHGHLLPGPGTGGSAALATIVRAIKPDLMLDAGDMFSGSPVSDAFQGEPVIDVMNEIGYDAAAIGNHEFNFGLDALRARARQANFPFLSANTVIPIDEINPAAIYNAQGVRIAIIGLTSEEVKRIGHPKNLQDVDVLDVVKGVESALPRVRHIVDFVILLTHVTKDEETRLARAFPEIKLIVGGDEDKELHEPIRVGETMIVRTGRFGRYVGLVNVSFDQQHRLQGMKSRLIPTEGAPEDPGIRKLIEPYEARVRR